MSFLGNKLKDILAGASISNDELSAVQSEIDSISGVLTTTTEELDGLDSNLADTKQAILQAKATLEFLKADADRRQMTALEMKEKITSLQESNVEGALTLTQEALEKSQNAKQKVELVSLQNGFLTNSEVQRKATESLMDKTGRISKVRKVKIKALWTTSSRKLRTWRRRFQT